ncbi:MAG: 2-oxo-4-hydroxy-4-carboxy-5-ureidoimidazoline decarboxylase [Arthrobacter sp.]|uniref:2-oxo-4-hydroxy-4-carboxy-5-ureidoimidazoline decarboxylase n=1 Tax=unclassified Arthrobacter TaxID=235627 RepID=UPI0026556EA0|nr:2-oxo-4-hydroxy-4-carboxy-5-ureidoimidazoline decarboxylase [Micrococcaceae bacterium]MDN5825179.1 2-oxo-4-hydroxy-4-carboxy-5-ureidoimidazoline decarboxylase [Micrococcaceae bacterium]MDN5879709.1 2-oxo-4-hydroxy-4-carboxy-5-ureidoimidazoline decarboxylase [Micrococcaceae bacterium]MDN5887456.1 2-oxo-4-hydroxy-4-carboxy-5-ureidoimidazoline decarboxylase [Micrococcaceae bacterium]MDN6169190.1 2-oxo-4-hydroxy-4-carboxy-5-ureidoimidazoline decarboxylase [Micrococcaceae bacterium]
MDLQEFNNATAEQAVATLRPCADIDRWIQGVVDNRPYAGVEDLLARAEAEATPFSAGEVDAALAHHPRIGEKAKGQSAEATLSRDEQSAVDAESETARRILEGNKEYEQKFGRVFLIRAAGRSAEEILAELERRQANSEEAESAEVAVQLREIALLRLRGLFATT